MSNRRARVLMLVDRVDRPGGAERLLVGIATRLPAERFEVAVCATRSTGGMLAEELERAGVDCFALGRRGRYDLLPFARLARYLRSREVQVLHSHLFGSNLWGSLIGRACGVPVRIAHEHGWSYGAAPRRIVDGQVIGRLVSAFVAGTRADAERMISLEGVPAEKTVIIPGAYIPRPAAPGASLRTELGLSAEAKLVGAIGWLRPEKGYGVLIEAFASLAGDIPDLHLVIAGDGPCRESLEASIDRLGLRGRAHLLGAREDIETVLRAIDVAVISSDHESTSLFALEAIAYDTPLVSTRVGGPSEFLDHGRSALLVSPRNPGELAAAMRMLIGDESLRKALASEAREVLERFTIERVAAMHAELYERLLGEARAAD